ncbi:hypothetical protein ACH5AO_01250 [Streptomyces sp. NPDC018964]|uniref:hypothetical protein n=1 Tax=Streptomyces sp. NPDC018964 TaxID=3365058 RepID=UPI003799EB7A
MAAADPKATHGMLVVGEETAYLSHLPMFMRPHDFQVLLEAAFTNDAGDAQQVYADDRRTTGTAVYTLKPERFVLTELVGEDGQPVRTSFTGTLFRGHFERDGTELLDRVTVEVRHVVHFRRFDHHAVRPTELTYLAFGKGDERFLAHLVTLPPDFDHVVAMRQAPGAPGTELTDDVLRNGPALTITGRPDGPGDRLREGDQVAVGLVGDGSAGTGLRLVTGREFYLEEGELAEGGHAH